MLHIFPFVKSRHSFQDRIRWDGPCRPFVFRCWTSPFDTSTCSPRNETWHCTYFNRTRAACLYRTSSLLRNIAAQMIPLRYRKRRTRGDASEGRLVFLWTAEYVRVFRTPYSDSGHRRRGLRFFAAVVLLGLALRPGDSLTAPENGFVDELQMLGFPHTCHPSYGGLASTPAGFTFLLNTLAFIGHTGFRYITRHWVASRCSRILG